MNTRTVGITLLSAFFAFGTLMALLAAVTLLLPDNPLNYVWRINPQGHEAFRKIGNWSLVILITVAVCCAAASIGLWLRKLWGYWIAQTLLAVNLIGDIANIVIRSDLRATFGIPIVIGLLYFMSRPQTRRIFAASRSN